MSRFVESFSKYCSNYGLVGLQFQNYTHKVYNCAMVQDMSLTIAQSSETNYLEQPYE
jgi:hypothetical protein